MKKSKSVFEAGSIVAGSGIGSGVMTIPYFVEHSGLVGGLSAFALAYIVSVVLHLMIAEIMLQMNETADILAAFNKYLFTGRFKNALKYMFFAIMVVVLETNLAAYISGASDIVKGMIHVPAYFIEVTFYVLAAIVVLFGLKSVSVSEKISVVFMGALLLTATVISFGNVNESASLCVFGGMAPTLACFGMIMFSFSAIFSVPQVIEILDRDKSKVRISIFLGFLINLIISIIITICTIATSKEVTEIAIVGWADSVGGTIRIIGSVFIVFAMFTSYWSIGLATTDIIAGTTKKTFGMSFVLATIPALVMTFFLDKSFMEYMKIAGGAVAVIISLLLIPTFVICTKEKNCIIMRKYEKHVVTTVFIFVMYILMAIGSFISV